MSILSPNRRRGGESTQQGSAARDEQKGSKRCHSPTQEELEKLYLQQQQQLRKKRSGFKFKKKKLDTSEVTTTPVDPPPMIAIEQPVEPEPTFVGKLYDAVSGISEAAMQVIFPTHDDTPVETSPWAEVKLFAGLEEEVEYEGIYIDKKLLEEEPKKKSGMLKWNKRRKKERNTPEPGETAESNLTGGGSGSGSGSKSVQSDKEQAVNMQMPVIQVNVKDEPSGVDTKTQAADDGACIKSVEAADKDDITKPVEETSQDKPAVSTTSGEDKADAMRFLLQVQVPLLHEKFTCACYKGGNMEMQIEGSPSEFVSEKDDKDDETVVTSNQTATSVSDECSAAVVAVEESKNDECTAAVAAVEETKDDECRTAVVAVEESKDDECSIAVVAMEESKNEGVEVDINRGVSAEFEVEKKVSTEEEIEQEGIEIDVEVDTTPRIENENGKTETKQVQVQRARSFLSRGLIRKKK